MDNPIIRKWLDGKEIEVFRYSMSDLDCGCGSTGQDKTICIDPCNLGDGLDKTFKTVIAHDVIACNLQAKSGCIETLQSVNANIDNLESKCFLANKAEIGCGEICELKTLNI